VIAGVVLKEKTTWLQNVFMAVSVCSVIALFVIGSADAFHGLDIRGLILLMLSTLSCAASNVLMRYVKKEHPPLEVSFYCCFMGTAIFWGITLIVNAVTGNWQTTFAPLSSGKFVWAILYLGICCTFITSNLISYSLRHLPAVNATIWGNVSTAISVVAGALLLREPLMPYQVICTVLIITGVMGISFSGKQQNKIKV